MENVVSEDETASESEVRFPVALRGYDRRQVDEYVRVAEKRVERLEKARRTAERRLAKAQIPAPRAAQADQADGLGKRIEKILEVAKSEAEEIRNQARKDSADLLATAEKTVREAEHDRAETEREAAEAAEQVRSRAEQEAVAIRATHSAALSELGQIARILDELRERFGGTVEAESPAELESADSAAAPDVQSPAEESPVAVRSSVPAGSSAVPAEVVHSG